MVQKKLPLINSTHGSETRNIINELIKLFNQVGYTYDEALKNAQEVLDEAERTNDMNTAVNERLDQFIADSGTSSTEVVDARGEFTVLGERLSQFETVLSRKPDLKIFREVPSTEDLLEGEVGLVIVPPFPFMYDFTGVDGSKWNASKFKEGNKFESVWGTMNKEKSVAKIEDNAGKIIVSKGTEDSLCVVDTIAVPKLDFTNGKKYRIKFRVKRHEIVDDSNRGVCGITLSPENDPQTYYPHASYIDNAYSLLFASTSASDDVLVRLRNVVDKAYQTDSFIHSDGGYASASEDRLLLPQTQYQDVDIGISTNGVQVTINGIEYLNVTEDLSVLDGEEINLALWGMSTDAGSLVTESHFDDLIIDEVI